MTSLLTTMRQCLADAENDAERLRAAIEILEQAEAAAPATSAAAPSAPAARRAPRRTQAAAATATATATAAPSEPETAAAVTEAPQARPQAVPAPRRRKPAAKKPAKSVVPLEKLLKVVGENPGLTTTAIARETGGEQSALLELLKESEQKGDVRRQGERRATSWYLITDEDRIAARAAEIAAQSKAAGAKGSAKPARRKAPVAA
jgi:hypothetical protein